MIERPEKSISLEKRRLLVLGAGLMQGPALRIAKEMGLETVAADADPGAACIPLADRFEKVDLKDREGIGELARSLAGDGGLAGIMTAGTDFSASVAWAAEKLNLPGISFETALDASDKERMRRRFWDAGIPAPDFVIVKKVPREGFQLPFAWPAVVKPVDNMGSRGCRRVDSFPELKSAVEDALNFSRSGRVIVEEYMDGPEFSIDALVYRGEITVCGVADRHIFFPPYFIEMGHTMPSEKSPALIKHLLETFCRGVRVLGIDNGAAKGDVKLTPRGPMIGEIAARLSGGYMSGWTYPYSSGVLPTAGAIKIAIGEKPEGLSPLWNWVCAERAFISIPGKVRSVEGIERAKAMPWVKNVFTRVKPGDEVTFPENNVSKCGNIISAAPGRKDACNSAESAARSILIRLHAPNEATRAFLAAPLSGENTARPEPAFPPDAFAVSSRVLALLEALPESSFQAEFFGAEKDPPEAETLRTDKGAPGNAAISLVPFPEFTESGLLDYVGRGVKETLEALEIVSGLELPIAPQGAAGNESAAGAGGSAARGRLSAADGSAPAAGGREILLGRSFWRALIRGGYQGAAYYIDCMRRGDTPPLQDGIVNSPGITP